MNCKPGDLAVVVRATAPDVTPYLGRIVRCVKIDCRPFSGGDCWMTEPELEPNRSIFDGALYPIRDPGDDATDEMIVLLGKPVREGETA